MDPQARQRRGLGVLHREPGRAAGHRAAGRALPRDSDPEPDATAHGHAHRTPHPRPDVCIALAGGPGVPLAGALAGRIGGAFPTGAAIPGADCGAVGERRAIGRAGPDGHFVAGPRRVRRRAR